MDKALFRAYVKELVKETVQEEINKQLPKLLGEAIDEIKSLKEQTTPQHKKSKFSREQLAEMLGLERHGDTIIATTKNIVTPPPGMKEDNPTFQAINKNYSELMKKMGLNK